MPMVAVGDTRLHYWQRGEGPVALLVHGFPLDATMWLDQLALLSGVRRCVAVDLRGFGRSDPALDEILTMERHADDLAAFLDALGVETVDLVGLSMGGYVALAFAQLHPARLRTLALVDTRSEADGAEARAGRDETGRRLLTHGRPDLADRMEPALLAPAAAPPVRARIRTMIESIRYETVLGALEGMKQRPDRTSTLRRIDVPVAVITGEHDAITPPQGARAMAAAISGATYTEIAGAGHMSPMESPDAVAGALQVLFAAP
jgi:3-oxoadipate enol-lactonase